MKQYKLLYKETYLFEDALNELAKDGWEPCGNIIYHPTSKHSGWDYISVLMERKTDIVYANELLAVAAELAYQSDVIDTQMERNLIGNGNEYADKQDWIESWLQGLIDTVSTQDLKN
jgi:hypothetical protein